MAGDLKKIYTSDTEDQGLKVLEAFSKTWDEKFPHISKSWKSNWAELSTFFKYSPEIRKLIYTTNPTESFHRSLRKVMKIRSIFPSEESCLKLVYLAIQDIEKRWTQTIRDWGRIYSQLSIHFEEQVSKFI